MATLWTLLAWIFLLWSELSSPAAGQIHFSSSDGKILTGGEGGGSGSGSPVVKRRTFKFCRRSDRDRKRLSCYCDAGSEVLELSGASDTYRDLLFMSRRGVDGNEEGGGTVSVLEILLCPLHLTEDFFPSLLGRDDFRNLSSVEIYGAPDLSLDTNSLSFPSDRIGASVVLSSLGAPLSLTPDTFGPGLRSLRLERVKLAGFSSDVLSGLPSDADVSLVNCTLVSARRHPWHFGDAGKRSVRLASLSFSDLVLLGPGHTFLEVEADLLSFRRCHVSLFGTGSVRAVVRGRAEFVDSSLKLLAKEALDVAAEEIVFERVKLEPRHQSLFGLNGLPSSSNSSLLRMSDVILRDPSKGVLLFRDSFSRLSISNVSVADLCLCDQVNYLISQVNELGFRFGDEPPSPGHLARLEAVLANETFCLFDSGERKRPVDLCGGRADASGLAVGGGFDGPSAWILGLLCLGVLGVVVFSGFFLYKWHRVIQARYRILRSMKVISSPVQENITRYKERLVSFDKNVRVIPRPPSVFYIAAPAAAAKAEAALQQPDLVRSVSSRKRATVFRRGGDEDGPNFDSIIEREEEGEEEGVRPDDIAKLEEIERRTMRMVREMDTGTTATTATMEEAVEFRPAKEAQFARFVSIPLNDA